MTSDATLNGNIADLPADFFVDSGPEEVVQQPAERGAVKDLPADFFAPEDSASQNDVIYREDTDTVLGAPQGLSPAEITYFDDTQNNGQDDGGFLGLKRVGNPLDFAKGYMRGIISGGTALATVGLEADERRLRRLQDLQSGKEQYGFIDWLFEPGQPIWGEKKTREERWAEEEAELITRISETKEAIQDMPRVIAGMGLAETGGPSLVGSLGEGTTSLAQTVGLTVATKNPAYAATVMALQQKSNDYYEARQAGLSIDDASESSNISAGTVALIEAVGTQALFKAFGESTIIKRAFKGFLVQGTEEGAQELAQILVKNGYDITDTNFNDAVSQIALATLIGGLLGAPVSGAMGPDIDAIARETGIPKSDLNKLVQIIEGQVSDNPALIEAGKQEMKALINDEFSPLKDNAEARDKVIQLIESTAEGQPVDLSILNENERASVEEALQLQLETQPSAVDNVERRVREGDFAFDLAQLKIEDTQVKGRVDLLQRNIKALDNQIESVANEINQRLVEEKPVQALEKKIDKLIEERQRALAESENIQDEGLRRIIQPEIGKSKIEIRADFLERTAERLQRDQARKIRQVFTETLRAAKADIKAVQTTVIDAIEKSGLKPNDRAKFIRQIKNIQTAEQFEKAAPKIEGRIVGLLEDQSRRNAKTKLKKILKRTKPGTSTKKPVGKFGDAQTQAFVDRLREASQLTREAAEERLAKNLTQSPTPELALENRILSIIADTKNTPVSVMEETLQTVADLVAGGREAQRTKELQRRADMDTIRETLINTVTKDRDVKDISQISQKELFAKGINMFRAFESALTNGWYDTLDVVFGRTKGGREVRDILSRGVHRALQREKGLNIEYGGRFVQAAMDAFGLKKGQLGNKFVADEKVEALTDSNGKVYMFQRNGEEKARPWEISRAQARKLWMEFQDETLVETLTSEDGNGITEEMQHVLFTEFLTQEDIDFARAQLELYKEIYPDVNDIYADIYGVYLPSNENYSPIRRRHKQEIGNADEFLTELKERSSTTPSFAKSRVSTTAEILPQSDVAAMLRHSSQAAHFVSMAQTARDLQSVFGDTSVREAIDKTWGTGTLEILDGYIEDFTAGSIKRAEGFWNVIDKFNSNFAVSVLALKPNLFAKQMTSFVAYASDIPTVHFVNGVIDFAKNPRKAMKILGSGPLMQARGANQDVEIAKGAQRQAKKLIKSKARLDDIMLLAVKLGDRGAIYLGGWSVYKYHRDVLGKTHEEALAVFEETTARTQQSSDLDQMSRFQASRNPVARTFTMFMTAPNAYYRASKRAIRQGLRGEIGVPEMTKRLAIYNMFLPILFQYASDAFEWDDENQKIALYTGFLDGLFIVGPIWEKTVAYMNGVYYHSGGTPNFLSGTEEFGTAVAKSVKNGEIALQDLLEATGHILGLPIEQGYNIEGGLEDIKQGKEEQGIKRLLGFTENKAKATSGGGSSGRSGGEKKSAF